MLRIWHELVKYLWNEGMKPWKRNGDTLGVTLVNHQLLKARGAYEAIIDSQCLGMKYMFNK